MIASPNPQWTAPEPSRPDRPVKRNRKRRKAIPTPPIVKRYRRRFRRLALIGLNLTLFVLERTVALLPEADPGPDKPYPFHAPLRYPCATPGCLGRWRLEELTYVGPFGYCPDCAPVLLHHTRCRHAYHLGLRAVVLVVFGILVQFIYCLYFPEARGGRP